MTCPADMISPIFDILRRWAKTFPPDLFYWAKLEFEHSPHDNWWMTETGMIVYANFPSQPIKPGSMGRPVPGIEAAVIDTEGNPCPY